MIAEHEETVLKGEEVTDKVKLQPVTGLPRTYYGERFQERPGVPSRLPGLNKASPVQYRAFADKTRIVVAVGNFWLKGEHFFKLRISGLKGNYEVRTGKVSRGIFSGEKLAEGILMQTGALRWRFITVEKREKPSLPLFSDDEMERLLKTRKPFIDRALREEAKRFEERFRTPDLSDVAPVVSGGFSAKPEGGMIAVTVPGTRYLVDVFRGGRLTAPAEMASPAFWWTPGGPAGLKNPFKVTKLAALPAGILLEMERTLNSADKNEVSLIKVKLTYCFRKNGFSVTADLTNASDDPVPFAFRFSNFFPGKTLRADGKSFPRNYAVSLFRRSGKPDPLLDNVGQPARIAQIGKAAVAPEGWGVSCKPDVYGFFAWDSAAQKHATLEPVWDRVMLGPGRTTTYTMDVTQETTK